MSEQHGTVNEELVNAISDLLQYSPPSKKGEAEETRKRKIRALHVISENWDKELMIEYIWAAIKDEQDIDIKGRLIEFIISKREIKAFPRLFRFCQIGVIPNQLQRKIGQKFLEYYDHFKDELDEAEDLDHAINVLGKTLVAKDSQSLPLALSILTSYEGRPIIPTILGFKIPRKMLKELVWAIARNDLGVTTLFTKSPSLEHVDQILLDLAETLLLNHSKAPNDRVTIDTTSKGNWSQYIDLPSPVLYLISKAKTVHASKRVRMRALKLLVSLQEAAIGLMESPLEDLTPQDLAIIDDIHKEDLYFDAVQLPSISSLSLKRIFAEKRFKGILGKYNLSEVFSGDRSMLEKIDLELLKRLENLGLLKEIPFIDTKEELEKLVRPMDVETAEIVEEFMDEDDFTALKEFLDAVEYSLLTILEHHRLFTHTAEQLLEGMEFGKEAILEAFFSESLPESFREDPRKPFILLRYLTAEIIRQTIISVAVTTSTEELRGLAFELLQKPVFWQGDEGYLVSSLYVPFDYLSRGSRMLKIESDRQTREQIFLALVKFLELLEELLDILPEEGDSYEYPFSAAMVRQRLGEARDTLAELHSHYLGSTVFAIYSYIIDGTFVKLDTSIRYPVIAIPHLIKLYFLGLNQKEGLESMEHLLTGQNLAKQEFLRHVDEIADQPQELLPLNVNAIKSLLQSLVEDPNPGIRTKSRFLLKKITDHKGL